ncbi:pyridoxamine 5'-phosphate oxidase [Streptococcus chenjunshii]|uniref:Pyridoxamine 5'-phosphate oxidase n=1 Tax=Streptococcus chenjunshii TaxID=2173853 RepID=A0A372KL44_9STRE|nr:pyridoxamine 5'-phosphate oxidase family protein [Streptococcus chenjunshii]AXQ77714.1 pyridoxamine 5'-phosphate oxidase [Streptococcus chenjunshii]RFU50844.1 pyridoxamine 5'-phosphate oxidase [Streptococcus chenjunshii]RFU52990.1 pyridoxamine 5'-phosphate oxidase [Streptococcus chenjunshii]
MQTSDYLTLLVDDIHSVVAATVDPQGNPATRVIDMMYEDGKTVYFLTANSKSFYKQLQEKPFISITGLTQGKSSMERKMISLTGTIRHLGKEKLDVLLKKNPYLYDIYPTEESRKVLEVFAFSQARGEFYDLTVLPPHTDSFHVFL